MTRILHKCVIAASSTDAIPEKAGFGVNSIMGDIPYPGQSRKRCYPELMIFRRSSARDMFKRDKRNIIMNMHDLLRRDPQIWDLFTRKEEYDNPLRDRYDRFPYYVSKNRDIFEPRASQSLAGHGYSVQYPDNAPFAVCLTHDIDTVYRSIPSKAISTLRTLKQGNISGAFRNLSEMRSKKLPLCNFHEIMDLEEQYGAKSTFFFLAGSPGEQDYSYDIEDLKPEIRNIIDRGWEVGLHGGHNTYLNFEEMRLKKERLEKVAGKPVIGYRNHFLRFRVPDTWEYLSQAGFLYDTTLGYADCVGFRNGMCHPFRPYNLNTGREIDIVEIPLVVMDGTLDGYMRLDASKAWELIRRLIDYIEQCHGVFTLLWHNTYMEDERLRFYKKVLAYCREKDAWMTSGEEIEKRWTMNG